MKHMYTILPFLFLSTLGCSEKDTADTGETADTGGTTDTGEGEDTADTEDTEDTEDIEDTADTADTADTDEGGSTEEGTANLGHNGPGGDEADLWEPELSWECYSCNGKDLADAHSINSVDVAFPSGICYNLTDKTTSIGDEADCSDTWVQFPDGQGEGSTGPEGSARDVCFVRQSDDSFTATEGSCLDVDSSWTPSTIEANILQDCVDHCIGESNCKAFDDEVDSSIALADIDYQISTEGSGCWIFSE